ncbi:MAG: hypothetical protein QXD23_03485 [Candidatus Micrarchaeaceae archaeon]
MPKLITPDSDNIISFSSKIKNLFENYSQKNQKEASINLFNSLEAQIKVVSLPIQFWQTPSETLKNQIGDELDFCSLLCSSLIALGCVLSKVLILNSEDKNTMFVYYEQESEVIAFQYGLKPKTFKSKNLFFNYLIENINTETNAYEFNDKLYRDIILPLFSS